MVSILIVDDHSLMRRAVREVIEKEAGLTVVAEACNGQEAEAKATESQPDVILMDLDLPDSDGFDVTERVLIQSPVSRVIIFTATHQDHQVFQAIQRGAIGYITKDIEADGLIHAIRCAARNDFCIPGMLATPVLSHLRSTWPAESNGFRGLAASSPISYRMPRRSANNQAGGSASDPNGALPTNLARPLTMREREILHLMRKGRKNREIAGELCIAESTVHKHVQNIFEKLHARNRTEAIYLTSAEV